jgi:hypothetical protein
MHKRTITIDYEEYKVMEEKLKVLEETLEDDKRIYYKTLNPISWSYSSITIPECIVEFLNTTTISEFKKLVKKNNKEQ